MASAEAKLKLVISATSTAGPVFAALIKEAEMAGLAIQKALSGAKAPTTAITNVNTALASVTGNAIGANGQINTFAGNIGTLNMKMPTANRHLDEMGKMFGLMAVSQASSAVKEFGESILGVLGEGISQAMEFEQSIVDISNALSINKDSAVNWKNSADAVAELGGQMDKLGDKALAVALKTKFNDKEMMQLTAYLTQNGIAAKTVLDGALESTAILAQATNSEWKPAAETMTAVLHAMGKTLDKDFGGDMTKAMAYVGDIMTNINQTTGESLTTMGSSFKYVLPIADEFGSKFGDVAVMVDLFARSGIRGSMAGTSLRRMYTSLLAPTEKAADMISVLSNRMGLGNNMFVDSRGKLKSLSEIQRLLYESTKGMTDADKAQTIQTIFKQYAFQTMMKLVSTAPAEYADLTEKILTTGTAQKKAADWALTAAGKWDIFMENVNSVKRLLGTQLLPVIKPVIDFMNNLVSAFANLSPETQKTIAMIAGVIGVLAVVIGTVGGAIASFGLFAIGLSMAGVTLGGVAISAGLVVVAIAAVAAIAYVVYKAWTTNFGGIRDFTNEVWAIVKPTIIDGMTAVKDSIVAGLRVIIEWWHKIKPTVEDAIRNIIIVLEWLSPLWNALWDGVKGTFRITWDTIKTIFDAFWKIFSGTFQLLVDILSLKWGRLWDDVKLIFEGVWQAITGVFFGIAALLAKYIGTALEAIIAMFVSNKSSVLESARSIVDGIVDFFIGMPGRIVAAIERGMNAVKSAVSSLFSAGSTSIKVDAGSTVQHAAGGIFTGPTLLGNHLFGEAGPEALIPLSRSNLDRYGFPSNSSSRTTTVVINYNGSGSRSDAEHLASMVRREVGLVGY